MTFVPIDVAAWCCFVCAILGFVTTIRSKRTTVMVLSGFLCLSGFVLQMSSGAIQRGVAHEAAFAELPSEWLDFYEGLSGVEVSARGHLRESRRRRAKLQATAILRFIRTNPPELTVKQYNVLCGSELWFYENSGMRLLANSSRVQDLVVFDFVDEK